MGDLRANVVWSNKVTLDWIVASRKSPQVTEWRLTRSEPFGANAGIDIVETKRVNYEAALLEPNSTCILQIHSRTATAQQVASGQAASM